MKMFLYEGHCVLFYCFLFYCVYLYLWPSWKSVHILWLINAENSKGFTYLPLWIGRPANTLWGLHETRSKTKLILGSSSGGSRCSKSTQHITSLSELCHCWLDRSRLMSARFPRKATDRPSLCRISANLHRKAIRKIIEAECVMTWVWMVSLIVEDIFILIFSRH